jgi:micrococcal nuclease
MKSFLLLPFLLTAFAGICQQPCIVTHVIDGDTYKIFYASKFQTVRLLNVDAPEIGQYFGTNAKDSVTKLLLGRTVNAALYKKDLYGRQLVSIQLKGINFDSLLLARGWATFYYKYSNNKMLAATEATAKLQCTGIWQCFNNVPPWIWRKLNKRNKQLYSNCRKVAFTP